MRTSQYERIQGIMILQNNSTEATAHVKALRQEQVWVSGKQKKGLCG